MSSTIRSLGFADKARRRARVSSTPCRDVLAIVYTMNGVWEGV